MANTCTPEICQQVIELMSEGLTLEEVCAVVGVARRTMFGWRDKKCPYYEKDFDEAYQVAKAHQMSWWLNLGRANLGAGKDFNTALFSLYMANMFGWRSGAKGDDEAMQEIRKLKEQIGMEDS